MKRPPVRWTDTELPEHLARVLNSAGPAPDDDVALARMRARLSDSLGRSFESRRPETNPRIAKLTAAQGRVKWLAAGALVAASLAALVLRPAHVEPAQSPSFNEGPNASGAPQSANVEATPQGFANAPCAVEVPVLQRTAVDSASAVPPKGRRSQRQSVQVPAQAARSGLAEELRGIEQIRALMGASPARALAEAQAQQRRFSRGALAAERELLRVEALLRMGRVSEAKARAHAHGTPSGPYRKQLEKLLAAHTN